MKVELTNPALDKKGSIRVSRGGNYYFDLYDVRASYRLSYGAPTDRDNNFGFRLVKTK
jgi:formylglycine-generating enzyme required for sulfatase activity